jgi:hypothetical protein
MILIETLACSTSFVQNAYLLTPGPAPRGGEEEAFGCEMWHEAPHFTSKPLLLPLPFGTPFGTPEAVRGAGGWVFPARVSRYQNAKLLR